MHESSSAGVTGVMVDSGFMVGTVAEPTPGFAPGPTEYETVATLGHAGKWRRAAESNGMPRHAPGSNRASAHALFTLQRRKPVRTMHRPYGPICFRNSAGPRPVQLPFAERQGIEPSRSLARRCSKPIAHHAPDAPLEEGGGPDPRRLLAQALSKRRRLPAGPPSVARFTRRARGSRWQERQPFSRCRSSVDDWSLRGQ